MTVFLVGKSSKFLALGFQKPQPGVSSIAFDMGLQKNAKEKIQIYTLSFIAIVIYMNGCALRNNSPGQALDGFLDECATCAKDTVQSVKFGRPRKLWTLYGSFFSHLVSILPDFTLN